MVGLCNRRRILCIPEVIPGKYKLRSVSVLNTGKIYPYFFYLIIIYFLENPLDVKRLEDAYTFLTDNKDKCVIIDEVQTIPSLFSVLRSVIDADRGNNRFILLGSASPN